MFLFVVVNFHLHQGSGVSVVTLQALSAQPNKVEYVTSGGAGGQGVAETLQEQPHRLAHLVRRLLLTSSMHQ